MNALSDGEKLQAIYDSPRVKREWLKHDLSREERRFVLSAIEPGLTSPEWLMQVIRDVREMRKDAAMAARV